MHEQVTNLKILNFGLKILKKDIKKKNIIFFLILTIY